MFCFCYEQIKIVQHLDFALTSAEFESNMFFRSNLSEQQSKLTEQKYQIFYEF